MSVISDCLHYLEKLVAFNTVSDIAPESDQPNRPLIDWAKSEFEALGFDTRVFEYKPGKADLFAFKGPMTGRTTPGGLLLSGHSDTVGCNPELWTNSPWSLTIRDGRAYGLGSCDMKGFIASAMALARRHPEAAEKGFGVLITCDEETSMAGARAAVPELKNLGVMPQLAVVGEPTELSPVFGHKGYMGRAIIIRGRGAHSSDPTQGINAVKTAALAVEELNSLEARLKTRREKEFDHPDLPGVPYPTLNIGSIRGGDNVNRVCAEARLEFDIRPLPKCNAAEIRGMLDESMKRLAAASPASTTLEVLYPDLDPFINPDPGLRSRIEAIAGREGAFVSYSTEASFLQQLGATVVLGPGSIRQAHGVDEYIELSELEKGMTMLKKLWAEFVLPSKIVG